MNEAKADMNVSMGDWVTNSLPPNQSQVKWHSSEAPEIGKYFFDNHLNVAEIKIPAGQSIVYSRFNTCEDAVEFAGLPYALYKGVKINRRRYVDTPEFMDARLRVFLTGTKQEGCSPSGFQFMCLKSLVTSIQQCPMISVLEPFRCTLERPDFPIKHLFF